MHLLSLQCIYWFALTARSQVLTPLIIPLLVQQFVGEAQKGTYVGRIRLWSLMVAVLMQAVMGLLSDRSTSRWGRRRPFIVVGSIGEVVVFTMIGLSAGLSGMTGYWVLFAIYILSMIASNTAHAATQGLIPDLVPEDKRGLYSGIKALLELPLPLVFASFVVGKMVGAGNLWGALISLMVVVLICMLLTLPVREEPLEHTPGPLDWEPIIRMLLMTVVFTVVILGTGALVNLILGALQNADRTPLKSIIVSLTGLLGMVTAVILGVWATMSVSMGAEVKDQKNFIWWVTTRLAFLVASTNLAGFMLYFLQERFQDLRGEQAAGPASTIIMYVGIFIILTALPSGWLSDKVGKKPLVIIAGLLAALGTAIVVLVPSLTAIYIGGCFIGAAMGLFYAANWALGTDIVPQDQAGHYLGLSNIAGAGAGAIGAYIGGPIADKYGYVLLFSIYGMMFLLSMLTLQGVKVEKG
ncbi:MAG: MFS transporter [Anaerolineae bacterium]|nr:MFS transporter [Anaerolineae bacterium]